MIKNKTIKMKCPKCASANIIIEEYMGAQCIICNNCNYNQTAELDIYAENKISQKQKGRHTPYKTGGGKRTTSRDSR